MRRSRSEVEAMKRLDAIVKNHLDHDKKIEKWRENPHKIKRLSWVKNYSHIKKHGPIGLYNENATDDERKL